MKFKCSSAFVYQQSVENVLIVVEYFFFRPFSFLKHIFTTFGNAVCPSRARPGSPQPLPPAACRRLRCCCSVTSPIDDVIDQCGTLHPPAPSIHLSRPRAHPLARSLDLSSLLIGCAAQRQILGIEWRRGGKRESGGRGRRGRRGREGFSAPGGFPGILSYSPVAMRPEPREGCSPLHLSVGFSGMSIDSRTFQLETPFWDSLTDSFILNHININTDINSDL